MTEKFDEDFWRAPAEYVREARRRSGMTQAQFAEHIGVRRSTVTNAENGRHALSAEPMIKALILGRLLDELH